MGDAYAAVLTDHHRIIRGALAENEGREVDTAGDGFFCVFDSPRAGIAAVVQMQRGFASHTWPVGEEVRVRMGLHTGEATVAPTGIVGLDVHKAARIAAVAHGGQVLVSEACAMLVRDLLKDGVSLRDLGSHRLKDLGRPEELFQLEATGLETDFPPIKTLDNPLLKHNLPVQLTTFVGRDAELAELSELVEANRMVTLTGPGGCGKTRLALQVASGLLDGSGAGVWFVDLAPLTDQDLVASTVASVFHLKESSATSVSDALHEALASRDLLIVLDNCEHVIDACAKLADGLLRACPDVHVLATSREPLGIDGEHVYTVPSLALLPADGDATAAYGADAVQLFANRARTHSRSFVLDESSLPVVVSICTHLDGIPLALELAAARLRSLSLAEVERRLEDRFRLVTGGSRTALPRHQTLLATMDWSYEALHQRDRAVFDRLSVFAGGFELDCAEAVCTCDDADTHDVADAVASLVDKSLVQIDPSTVSYRYGLNETSRQYAAERLGANPEQLETTRRAHASAYLELAEEHAPRLLGSDQDAATERLDTERDNFRAAIAYLLATPGVRSDVLRFAVALRLFWVRTSTYREGLEIVEEALALPDPAGDPLLEARANGVAARLVYGVGTFDLASRYVERGLRFVRGRGGDPVVTNLLVLTDLLVLKVQIQDELGDREGALRTADESIDVALRSGDDGEIAGAFNIRGSIRRDSDPDGAREDFRQAMRRAERVGDQHGLGRILVGCGDLEAESGNLDAAQQHWERGLELADPHAKNTLRLGLAWIALLHEDTARAAALTLATIQFITGDRDPEFYGPFALIYAALCLSASGMLEAAVELQGAADTMLASATGTTYDDDDHVTRLREEDLAKLRLALGDAYDGAYRAGLGWEQARRLAIEQLTEIVAITTED